METYGIVTSYATSLTVVANDIAYALNKLGHEARVYNRQVQYWEAKKLFGRAIVIIPFDPVYAPVWFLLQRDYLRCGIPSVTYVTVEGEPMKSLLDDWIKRDCVFIANSHFTHSMLEKVGIFPVKTIPHGVNLDVVGKLKPQAKELKQQIKQRLGVEVLFGSVFSDHPRKGLNLLAEAIKTVTPKLREAGFCIFTTPKGVAYFSDIDRVEVSSNYGKLDRKDALALIGSFDYYLHPALAEGFCLPILEAYAFGIPCIHPSYDPINEITHSTASFPIEIAREEFKDFGGGIRYLCHFYEPENMASQIERAYEIYTCNPKSYQEISQQVEERAKDFDCVKVYSEFLKGW